MGDIVIDRPSGSTATMGGAPVPERPGDETSPVWMPAEIEIACGDRFAGGVRITPPQGGRLDPKVTRATGVLAAIGTLTVDLMKAGERIRVGLTAGDTVPLRVRLLDPPPHEVLGLAPDDPRLPLARGDWSRPLDPVDLADDPARLAPLAW